MHGAPNDFWGKVARDERGEVVAWHPLEAHCADVAACCEALLRDTGFGRCMARLAGQDTLHPILIARLTVLAALHDLGKYAISFQNRPYPARRPQGGHIEPIVKALNQNLPICDQIEEVLAPIGTFGDAVTAYLSASISHHGRPEKTFGKGDATGFDPAWFRPAFGLDPLAGMRRLLALCQAWCPSAFGPAPAEATLPELPAVQHFFAGVVMLADWLGSDANVFAYAEDREDPMPQARARAASVVHARFLDVRGLREGCRADFAVFDRPDAPFRPRAAQTALAATPLPAERCASLTVLEAETGAGKTEAALHRFAQLFRAGLVDGLYFALPTRTSATQIHRRVTEAVASTFSAHPASERPPVVLAVPGYLRVDDHDGQALADFRFLWPDDDRGSTRHRTWAAENTKRFLAGCVVVGTIDQVLLSTLAVSHAHLRASALARLFLVVDEVHASDAYMTALLDRVLAFHFACGGHAMLMSATLGTTAQERFFARLALPSPLAPLPRTQPPPLLDAEQVPYPAIHEAVAGRPRTTRAASAPAPAKRCQTSLLAAIDAPELIARRALEAARTGAQVLVLRNTVADALATQQALEGIVEPGDAPLLFAVRGIRTLHHARFVDGDRRLLDDALEARLGKHSPRTAGSVVVATQTVQQSLDLDADLLITDLCPMDVLLQRIGRLHRHARPATERPAGCRVPRCEILDPGSLVALLDERGGVRSRHGFGSVYEDLRLLEATRTLLTEHPELCIPDENRMLVERTTHPAALAAVVERGGPSMLAHGISVDGQHLSHRQRAGGHDIDRTEPMGRYGFPSRDTSGRIATRLGEEDRLLELETPFLSAFGTAVKRVKIPHWLARAFPAAPVTAWSARSLVSPSEGVRLTVAGPDERILASFLYDRLGLRAEPADHPETAETPSEEHLADE